MKKTYRICLIGILLLSTAGCDQLTKQVAKAELVSAGPISLLNNLIRLEYAENRGAFLSMGEHLPGPILLLISSLLAGVVIFILVRLSLQNRDVKPMLLIGLSLIAGGSIGNLIDRVLNAGAVVDFMNVGIGQLRSGIFNVADVAILIGVFVLILLMSKQPAKRDAT
ncbi:MAG TPA: signal peptidase II [Pyrinomonadaceae bacterium]